MAYGFAQVIKWDHGDPLPEIYVGDGAAAHRATDDGKWDILIRGSKWEVNQKLTDAFENAVDLYLVEGRYLYALFPADTVPRSGLWDLDELIKARADYLKWLLTITGGSYTVVNPVVLLLSPDLK